MRLFLLAWLLTVIVGDLRRRRVPNAVVLAGAVGAVVAWWPGWQPWGLSPGHSLAAGLAGFAGLILFYAWGWMGAGDVKAAAVLGLWVGLHHLLWSSIFAGIMAAAHSIVWLICRHRDIPRWLHHFISGPERQASSHPSNAISGMEDSEITSRAKPIPYAAYLAAGAILQAYLHL